MLRLIVLTCCILICGEAARANVPAEGIGWIPTWKQGILEAQRTNKPMLIMSAAPQCGGISGVW